MNKYLFCPSYCDLQGIISGDINKAT